MSIFFSYSMARAGYIQCSDDVHFALDQHA